MRGCISLFKNKQQLQQIVKTAAYTLDISDCFFRRISGKLITIAYSRLFCLYSLDGLHRKGRIHNLLIGYPLL